MLLDLPRAIKDKAGYEIQLQIFQQKVCFPGETEACKLFMKRLHLRGEPQCDKQMLHDVENINQFLMFLFD